MKCLFLFAWLVVLMPLVTLSASAQSVAIKTDSIKLDNAVLYYHSYGFGTPIIVLSGGPGISAHQESDVAEQLGKSYRTILFEQRGTGRSWTKPMDSTTINLSTAIADIDRLRQRLKVEKINIYGHSWGAMLGAAYAAKHPGRVNLLILSGSGEINLAHSPIVNASMDRYWQLSDTTVAKYWSDSVNVKQDPVKAGLELRKVGTYSLIFDRNTIDRVFAQIVKGDKSRPMGVLMWKSLRRDKFNLETSLRAYKGPTLIVLGWQDPIGMSTLYSLMRTLPQAEVQGINECGHFASVEQPEKFFGIVRRFLNQHLPKPTTAINRLSAGK